MYILTITVLCLFFLNTIRSELELESYLKDRENLIEMELSNSVGGQLILNPDEIAANEVLMKHKYEEIDYAFQNPRQFNMSKPYFTYRDMIEKSPVYKIIRRMPKGAALHVHSTFTMDADYLVNLTRDDNLYVCQAYGNFKLQFAETTPLLPCPTLWEPIKTMRENRKQIDAELKAAFTMDIDFSGDEDINSVWEEFNRVYNAIKPLLMYRPVREKFIYDSLKKFYDDNIMYVEVRSGLNRLYELNGVIHEEKCFVRLYRDVVRRFIQDYPDFVGVKFILSKRRNISIQQLRDSLKVALQLKQEMPDFFAGYDLVAQEDLGKPLVEFLPALAEVKDRLDFYFHGGETNWFGTSSDENLVDAILLGSKRIGHGYALIKHPRLMEAVKVREIAIEINVISNAVLSLTQDVRNHPLATYLALGLPVVLSSDDPGVWNADPLSHDFYVAFMGVASRRADLRTLKQLALNSIRYSAMDIANKTRAYTLFDNKWCIFVKELIESAPYDYKSDKSKCHSRACSES